MCYAMTWKLCFTNNDDGHYRGLLHELYMNASVSTRILIILWNVMPNWMIVWLNNSKYAKTIFTTLEVQNYHFAPRDNMLGLTFKIYYRVAFTWFSWLRNLFHHLTNIYAWNNNSLKATKLRKLVNGATELKLACKDTILKLVTAATCIYLYMCHSMAGDSDGGD